MATDDSSSESDEGSLPDLTDAECAALHEVELGFEWFQRAQDHLLEFHHATGHGMDHLRDAETLLRSTGHDELANTIRNELLPHGVVDDDRWSYDVLENYQATLLAESRALERRVRRELADGERHVRERRQERTWKGRAREQ